MKNARRAAVFLALAVTVMMLSVTVFAAEDPYNVWLQTVEDTGTTSTLTVPVLWDGSATDGLLTVTYDPQVLSISEKDVSPADEVEKYSVNAEEPGVVKISWIIGKDGKEGTLFSLTFAVKKQSADSGLTLAGDAFSGSAKEEKALTVGTVKGGQDPAEPTAPSGEGTEPSGTAAPSTPSGNTPDTGDHAAPVLWLVLTAGCAAGAAVCAARLRRGM